VFEAFFVFLDPSQFLSTGAERSVWYNMDSVKGMVCSITKESINYFLFKGESLEKELTMLNKKFFEQEVDFAEELVTNDIPNPWSFERLYYLWNLSEQNKDIKRESYTYDNYGVYKYHDYLSKVRSFGSKSSYMNQLAKALESERKLFRKTSSRPFSERHPEFIMSDKLCQEAQNGDSVPFEIMMAGLVNRFGEIECEIRTVLDLAKARDNDIVAPLIDIVYIYRHKMVPIMKTIIDNDSRENISDYKRELSKYIEQIREIICSIPRWVDGHGFLNVVYAKAITNSALQLRCIPRDSKMFIL